MFKLPHRVYTSIILMIFASFVSFAGNPPSRGKESFTRIGIAPVINFYTLQTKHAIDPRSRMSFSAFVKKEWSMDRSNKTFFSVGLEYFIHGVNYRSYYFAQDTLQLYDTSFSYTYRSYIHELQLPLQVKFAFNSTTNSLFSPYVTIGYHLRYLLSSVVKVEQDGNVVSNKAVDMKFKNPFITPRMNSAVGIAIGFQSNHTRTNGTTFFVEAAFKYGFSPYYFKESYSASSVYVNSMHLGLNIGIGF